jgi:hypothetical protein
MYFTHININWGEGGLAATFGGGSGSGSGCANSK